MTLMNWEVLNLPMDDKFIYDLRSSGRTPARGIFFRGNFFITPEGTLFSI